ncbi:MAG: alpha/beta fold hydrolase [Chloroflexota bacterium]
MDLSFLDEPEALEVIFPLVYSPFFADSFFPSPEPDYLIPVAEGVEIGCEFWTVAKDAPTILFFHGNGETASGYESIAPLYNQMSINLFVADYRGYGASSGKPTVSNMLADAPHIFSDFKEIMAKEGFRGSLFVMGHSLGSMSAIEVAVSHGHEISGLIVESGSATNFRRLMSRLSMDETAFTEANPYLNKVKIRKVTSPTLIIHGELDELVPLEEGRELYQASGAVTKHLLVIPGVGHNDIMMAGELYFGTIETFVKTHAK